MSGAIQARAPLLNIPAPLMGAGWGGGDVGTANAHSTRGTRIHTLKDSRNFHRASLAEALAERRDFTPTLTRPHQGAGKLGTGRVAKSYRNVSSSRGKGLPSQSGKSAWST